VPIVKGIIMQHLTGEIRALSAMQETFILTADSYSTLTMKRVSVCGNATAASGALSEYATGTDKTTSCINYIFFVKFFIHFKPPFIRLRREEVS
jgi:hypothetical protein